MNTENQTYERHVYKKAPLQEAIFEAKFDVEGMDVTLPGIFFNKISKQFPNKNNVNLITAPIGVTNAEIKEFPIFQVPVMQAWNTDHTKCLQFGNGIIAANDTTYMDWESFVPLVKLLLKSYFECVTPLETKKIGYRCINRFVIPENNVIIPNYFRINLALPPTLQEPAGFDIYLVKQDIFNGTIINAKIRFSSDSLKINEQGYAFILDIDASTTSNLNKIPEDILNKASDCHEFLKRIFEDFLQNETRILIRG